MGFLSILGCGEWGCPFESLIVHYEDMNSEQIPVKVTDWEATKPLFGESTAFSGRCAKNENGVIQPLNHKVFIYAYSSRFIRMESAAPYGFDEICAAMTRNANGGSIWTGGVENLEKCLHEFFEEQALKTPESVALIDEENNEMIVCILGILKAGGTYLPVDRAIPEDRVLFMIRYSGAGIVMADSSSGMVLNRLCGTLEILMTDSIGWSADELQSRSICKPENLACITCIIYTSGSTEWEKLKSSTVEQLSEYMADRIPQTVNL